MAEDTSELAVAGLQQPATDLVRSWCSVWFHPLQHKFHLPLLQLQVCLSRHWSELSYKLLPLPRMVGLVKPAIKLVEVLCYVGQLSCHGG
ncbi:hypothetical protein AN642_00170 [Epulopiscium sp. SCG-B10WGA-EpuloA2]|nr:hypothetical protein AN642_00145 [Epulopiscium sp. SCG-B10WGA-EpuloA2]ONI45666.1 hypothetical protein AN642_00170 [Epulopiscium sp. SCG-B10WGA-EpuloA2]